MFRQTSAQTFFIVAKFCGNRAWTEAAAAANDAANAAIAPAIDAVAAIVILTIGIAVFAAALVAQIL